MTQINLRLPDTLEREADRYAHKHGFKNIQELAKEAIRMKVFEEESLRETMDILADKKTMESLERSREDVKMGRVVSWEELQKRWKKEHARK